MTIEGAQTTLRDTLETAFDQTVGAPEALVDTTTAQPAVVATPTEVTATPEVKTDRGRNPDGTFAPKKDEKVEASAQPAYTAPARPSSWKADLDPHWKTLPKEIHDEISRRESDYLKGITTYKGEWEKARPVVEALHQNRDLIEGANMRPEQFVSALAGYHRVFSGQDKEAAKTHLAKLVTDYQIPVHEMLVQGEDGKVYFNQKYFQPAQQQQQSAFSQLDVDKLLEQKLAQRDLRTMVQSFVAEKDASGNPKHPHFDEVKQTMDGLLRAGLAKDLPNAYQAALGMPQHSQLLEAQRQQQRETEAKEKARLTQEATERAKRNNVSPRTQTPTALVQDDKSRKGLRANLEEAYDAHVGASRV